MRMENQEENQEGQKVNKEAEDKRADRKARCGVATVPGLRTLLRT